MLQENDLISDIYGCVDAPHQWVSVLNQLKKILNASSVALQVYRRETNNTFTLKWSVRDAFSLQHAELHDKWVNNSDNPRHEIPLQSPIQVICDDDYFSPHSPRFQRFQHQLSNAGLGKAIMLDIQGESSAYICLIAHHLVGEDRGFSPDIQALLMRLAPHIKQAVSLTEKMNATLHLHSHMTSAMNQLRTGVLLLDNEANISWCNTCAHQLIDQSSDLSLINQKLVFKQSQDLQEFKTHFQRTVSSSSRGIRRIAVLGKNSEQSIEVLLSPVDQSPSLCVDLNMVANNNVIMFLKGKDSTSLQQNEIQTLFGLTPTESLLAIALAEGHSLNDYAERRGVSVGTARIQLKSVFSKMRINRQSELVQRLWSSVSASTSRYF